MATWFSRFGGFGARLKAWALGPAVVGENNGFGEGLQSLTRRRIDGASFLELSSAVFAAVDIRAASLASVPVKVYRVGDEGTREQVTAGPIVELLAQVNPFWTLRRLLEAVEVSLCIRGEAFIVADRGPNGKGAPRELWYARADRMKVIPHATDYIAGFVYEDPSGKKIALSAGEVIWLRGVIDPRNEFRSLSPLESARLSVETSLKAMESNMAIFTNGMSPGGILSPTDGSSPLTREQRELLEAQIGARLAGADKAHRVAVFSHPMKLETPQLTPADAEFMKLLGWTLGDVARVFKVPPTKLQDFSRATYSNAEQADKALYTDCIIPEALRIASDLTEQLIPMFGERDTIIEFDFSQVRAIQEDQTEITAQMAQLAAIGVPLNRLLEVYRPDLLPTEGGGYSWGNVPAAPGLPLAASAPVAPAPPPPAELEEAVRGALKAAGYITGEAPRYGSMAHRIELAARDRRVVQGERRLYDAMRAVQGELLEDLKARARAPRTRGQDKAVGAGDDLEPGDPFPLEEWRERYAAAGAPGVAAAMSAGGITGLRELPVGGLAFDISSPGALGALAIARNRLAGATDTAWRDIRDKLLEVEQAGGGVAQAVEALEGLSAGSGPMGPRRAETIARTEATAAYTAGRLEAWRQSGVVRGKRWLAATDDRTRHSHEEAHGQEVELDKPFVLIEPATPRKPEREVLTDGPGQSGVASEDINCRCELQPILGRAPKAKPAPPSPPPPPPALPPPPASYPVARVSPAPGDVIGLEAVAPGGMTGAPREERTGNRARKPVPAPPASSYPQAWVDPANPVSGETGLQYIERIKREARRPLSGFQLELAQLRLREYTEELASERETIARLTAERDILTAELQQLERINTPDVSARRQALMREMVASSENLKVANAFALELEEGVRRWESKIKAGEPDPDIIRDSIKQASGPKFNGKISKSLKFKDKADRESKIRAIEWALAHIDQRYLRKDQAERLAYTISSYTVKRSAKMRAYHVFGNGVYMAENDKASIYAHEFGHAIEAILDSGYAHRTQQFVERRAAGEWFYPLPYGKQTIEFGEFTREDRFQEVYTGKLYYGGDRKITNSLPQFSDQNAVASEVISMGLQLLWEDPVNLLEQDPDFLAFLWDYFRNRGSAL